jgi:hypothetical protein
MISTRLLRLVTDEDEAIDRAQEAKALAKSALKSYRERALMPLPKDTSSDSITGIYNDATMPQERSEREGERSIALGTPRGSQEAPHSQWTEDKINHIKVCSQTKIMHLLTPRLVTDQALNESDSTNSDFHRMLKGTPRRSFKERIRNLFS